MRLQVILGSLRPGRVGPPIARWAYDAAVDSGRFGEVELIDVAALGLPLLDEPSLPRFGDYTRDHTRRWSEIVSRADAFVFVTPEYNLAPPASLKNAVDYLHQEWWMKAGAVVSYGGAGAGLRAAQTLRQSLGAVSLFVVHEAVAIADVGSRVSDGEFDPPATAGPAAGRMFESLELLGWALQQARVRAAATEER